MRSFLVRLPSGARYWTVLDDNLRVVEAADEYLRQVRFGRDSAELTTKTYAGALVLFLGWCRQGCRAWQTAPGELGLFMTWLQRQPRNGHPTTVGKAVRGPRRVNVVLSVVREFFKHQVAMGAADPLVLSQLFRIADTRDLPLEVRGEDDRLAYRAAPRHRMRVPDSSVSRATDEEILALLQACRSARDRLLVLLMAVAGLRRSEAVGLRREDIHFVVDAAMLGCATKGAHLHVTRRDNPNGAWAKSRRSRTVPAHVLLVQAFDQYSVERGRCALAGDSDFVLVNLFRPPYGVAMPPGAVNELIERLCHRAHLKRNVSPHMLRHAFGSTIMDSGGSLDEVQHLLGHASITSSQVYLHPAPQRLRNAVERVGSLSERATP